MYIYNFNYPWIILISNIIQFSNMIQFCFLSEWHLLLNAILQLLECNFIMISCFFFCCSIEAYRQHYRLPNVKPAIYLDASQSWEHWGGIQTESCDLIVNINMMHISPLACTKVSFICTFSLVFVLAFCWMSAYIIVITKAFLLGSL